MILVAPDNEHYVMTAYTDAGDVDMAELKNYLALVGSVATESKLKNSLHHYVAKNMLSGAVVTRPFLMTIIVMSDTEKVGRE